MAAALIARGARVAVVGAGAAGLAAARAVREGGFNPTVFEAASECGGTWNYGNTSGRSSMYSSLRCNLPKEIMRFRDYPFPDTQKSFLGHRQVQDYLSSYAETFSLDELIKFSTKVVRITPSDESAWSVTVTNDDSTAPVPSEHHFDAVVIANGHYSTPNAYLPPGTSSFQGTGRRTVSHSHLYRTPKPFYNRRVVVLGAGPSGTDIAVELANSGAAEVFLSHRRGAGQSPYGGIVPQVSSINALTADGSVLLEDGSSLANIDDVLLCTGYAYELPFLDPRTGVVPSSDKRCIFGLVEHCVSLNTPTLSVIGLPWKVVSFPLFEDQSNFVTAVLSGKVSLDTLYALHRREMEEAQILGLENKYAHCLDDRQWEYRRRISDYANRPYPTYASIEVYNDSRNARMMDALTYREREYKVYGDGPGDWAVFENGEDVTGRDDWYSGARHLFSEVPKN